MLVRRLLMLLCSAICVLLAAGCSSAGSSEEGGSGDAADESTTQSEVIAAEIKLLSPSVRGDAVQVGALLDDSFREIGKSGGMVNKAETVDALANDPQATNSYAESKVSDEVVQHLSGEYYLLTYRLDSGKDITKRSSIWRVDSEKGPQMVFHQGTKEPTQ